MSDKPNNEMEKQLREYAQQRRKAAGTPQLHPATRQMLQAEVRQHCGTTQATTPKRGWQIVWPRFALGSAVLASLVAMFVAINRSGDSQPEAKFKLAKNEAPLAPMPAASPEMYSISTADHKEADTQTDRALVTLGLANTEIERRDVTKDSPAAHSPMAASTSSTDSHIWHGGTASPAVITGAKLTDAGHDKTRVKLGSPEPSRAIAKSAKAAPVLPSSAAPSEASNWAFHNATTQRFLNTAIATTSRRLSAPVVLDEFVVEQVGNSLKIVDRDGSVYRGNIQIVTNMASAFGYTVALSIPASQTAPASTATPATTTEHYYQDKAVGTVNEPFEIASQNVPATQNTGVMPLNLAFEVEGTNRSLRQRVVFSGNWIQSTALLNAQNTSNVMQSFQNAGTSTAPVESQNYNLQNSFINGRVYLNNSRNGTELNALPAIEQRR